MKKKFFVTALTVIIFVLCAVGLVACTTKSDEHTTHSWSNWTSDGATTHTRVCDDCGESETKDHSWDNGVITTPASCTETGVKTYTCTDCGKTKTQTIEKNQNHSYGKWVPDNETTHTKTCKCGESVTENHNFKGKICTDCDYALNSQTVEITNLYLDKNTLTLYVGDSEKLTVTLIPVNASNESLSWVSTAPDIATVVNGNVTGVSEGTTKIIVSSDNGKIAECNVQVSKNTNGFQYKEQGRGYTIVDYTGNETDLIIPSFYEGKPILSISAMSFQSCISLKSLEIPDSVSLIGYQAFANCINLKTVTIPDNAITIASDAFAGCTNIEKVNAPLTSVYYIPKNNIKELEILSGADIKDSAFENYSNLEKIILPETATAVGDKAFKGCAKLSQISLPKGIKSIGGEAFANCTSLRQINPQEGIKTIGREAFTNCTSLEQILLPDGAQAIEYGAFSNCSNIKEIHIPKSVTAISANVFSGCSKLETLTTPIAIYVEDITKYVYPFGYFFGTSKYENSIEVTQGIGGVKGNNTGVEETYYIPASLKTLLFSGTDLPNIMYIKDNGVLGAIIYTYDYFGAFTNCSNFTEITLNGNIEAIGNGTFCGCTSLKQITLNNNVTSIDTCAFRGCSSLINIDIPNSVTYIGEAAFAFCINLADVTIPDSVMSINHGTFGCCTNLTNVTIPDSVIYIYRDAFYHCTSLANVTISDSVTLIDDSAFGGCDSLTSITIPKSVTSIGDSAFNGCDSLTIYCEATSKPRGWSSDWNSSDCPVVWDCKNNTNAA